MHCQLFGNVASLLRKNVQKMEEGILGHAGNPFGEEFCGLANMYFNTVIQGDGKDN